MSVSLLLDRSTNDLCLDAAGNLAIASDPYAVLQDVACACSVNLGECWYDTTLGVPFDNILGQNPPLAYIKAQFVAQALTVPGVESAVCFISSVADREVQGQIQVTMTTGQTGVVQVSGQSARPFVLDTSALDGSNVI